MNDDDAPRGAGVPASTESDGDGATLAESLAAALCDPDLDLGAGDVLVVTETDGVLRESLKDGGLELLERALGLDKRAS